MTGTTAETTTAQTDAEIEQIHHVEIYVANVHQAAYFYGKVLGFEVVGELALEPPARRDRVSLALARDQVHLLLTAPLTSTSEIAAHLHLHGEGIKDVAFAVRGLDAVFERATSRGARSMLEPAELAASGVASGARGRLAVVRGWGELVHSVIETPDGAPLWNATHGGDRGHEPPDTALEAVDHVAIAVGDGELEAAVAFYCQAFGFRETHQQNVSTEYSAMRSKVVGAPNRAVQFPLVEPAQGRRTSQVQAFLHSHEGPGAQHLAFRSSDIVKSVDALRAGMDFLPTPAAYYDTLAARVGVHPAEVERLRRYGVLVDRDDSGLLLQIFTKPIGSRPTLFIEVIERRGAEGFGSGNIKALFEAIERQQASSLQAHS